MRTDGKIFFHCVCNLHFTSTCICTIIPWWIYECCDAFFSYFYAVTCQQFIGWWISIMWVIKCINAQKWMKPEFCENFANIFTAYVISGRVQHDTYSKAPITGLWFKLPNLDLTSFICSSVIGLSFLGGMKLVGNGDCLPLNGCLMDFLIWKLHS